MNKKVLSAILFSALFAGTGTFTSCIDNDEPAGIEELRGAKAELIRAKVAVEQANAAYTLAQAEVEKAKAAKQAALAKQEEATARLMEAQAEAEEAKTEKAKAKAEAKIAEIQQEMEIALLQHQASVLKEKQALAEAQRDYEIAIKQIEIAKALMSEAQKVKMSELIKAVEDLNDDIAVKQGEIDAKLAELKSASLVFELDSAFEVAKAEAALKTKQADLDANAELIATYKKYLANDSTLDVSAWREEIAKIEGEIAEYDKQIAVFKVDSAKALNGAERKALDKAIADAEAALQLEQDTLDNMVLAEDFVDTLLWFKGAPDMITYAKGTSVQTVAIDLAGPNFADEEDSLYYEGEIKELYAEYNSYTTERMYWLDSIKNITADKVAAASKRVGDAVKAWEDSLKAYNAGKNFELSIKTAAGTFVTAANDGNATFQSKKTAAQAFAKAITDAYAKLPAGQFAYNTIALPKPAKPTEYSKANINTFLTDATYQYEYLVYALQYFGFATCNVDQTTGVLMFTLDGSATDAAIDNVFAKVGTPATASTTATAADATAAGAVFASMIQKEILVNKEFNRDANFDNGKAITLLGKLIVASEKAFGAAANYVNAAEMTTNNLCQNDYLLHKPTENDVKHAVATSVANGTLLVDAWKEANIGIYGASFAMTDGLVQYVANNYPAIKADLKAAIDKICAFVDGVKADVKKANDDITAATKVVGAASQALTDYVAKVGTDYTNATAELDAKLVYMRRLADDLGYAVKLYLEDAKIYNNYSGEALFINYLKEELTKAEAKVIDFEYAVAKAEYNLQLVKDGGFTAAEKVATTKAELAVLEAEMAELVDELAATMEVLATAEEIWYAAE